MNKTFLKLVSKKEEEKSYSTFGCSLEYSYGHNISMMWYVGCPLLSVDIIKVMRLVGEGGTTHRSLEQPPYLVLTYIFIKFLQFSSPFKGEESTQKQIRGEMD